MKIELKRIDKAFHFEAENEHGISLSIDGSEAIGGHNQGFRPMQLLLASIAGCSAFDVGAILNKQKQVIEDFRITVAGERKPLGQANVFKNIHLHFQLFGPLDPAKVRRAIDLSLEKYCSVAKMLENTATISYELTVNETHYA